LPRSFASFPLRPGRTNRVYKVKASRFPKSLTTMKTCAYEGALTKRQKQSHYECMANRPFLMSVYGRSSRLALLHVAARAFRSLAYPDLNFECPAPLGCLLLSPKGVYTLFFAFTGSAVCYVLKRHENLSYASYQ
jgi:hypothetical protein